MISRVLYALALCLCLVPRAEVTAQEAESAHVVRVEPLVSEGKLYIDADVELPVNSEIRNAAQKGVPIYFTADLEIVSKRWWWFDKAVVNEQQTWRIVYNALTRQWRVGTGELSMPEMSFDDALSLVRNIRGWAVAEIPELDRDKPYEGRIRVRLDTSLLARPFQIDAFNSSAWSLATPWKNFTFSISVGTRDPS
jgi:hypothetical protein